VTSLFTLVHARSVQVCASSDAARDGRRVPSGGPDSKAGAEPGHVPDDSPLREDMGAAPRRLRQRSRLPWYASLSLCVCVSVCVHLLLYLSLLGIDIGISPIAILQTQSSLSYCYQQFALIFSFSLSLSSCIYPSL
jgi:hypothetical protein